MDGVSRIDDGESVGNYGEGCCCVCKFSLYLVPNRSQLGSFLADPPFVSDFVAPLSCPVLGFSQYRLECPKE